MNRKQTVIILSSVCAVLLFALIICISKLTNMKTYNTLSELNGMMSSTPGVVQTATSQVYYQSTASTPAVSSYTAASAAQTDTSAYSVASSVYATTSATAVSSSQQVLSGMVLQPGASTQEIINAMSAAVNYAKTGQTFTAVKKQDIQINLTECSVSLAVSPVNAILSKFTDTPDLTYNFVNGSCISPKTGKTVTPGYVIPPSDTLFALDAGGLTSATVTQQGTNTVYTVTLIPETVTLAQPKPYYHGMCMDYIDVNNLDLGIAKITQADISYPGATVTVVVDANGQILQYREYMPMSATGAGSVGISASGTIEGYLDETWLFTW